MLIYGKFLIKKLFVIKLNGVGLKVMWDIVKMKCVMNLFVKW